MRAVSAVSFAATFFGDPDAMSLTPARLAFLSLGLLVLACGWPTGSIPPPDGGWHCELPPDDFTESDLLGTWELASPSDYKTDTITLHEDRTYRQFVKLGDHYTYEGPPNRWWIDRRPNGGMYVHLEHMRYCNGIEEDCMRPEGGGGDWLFFDFCERTTFRMEDEVILALVGVGDQGARNPFLEDAPRGIFLIHMSGDIDGGTTQLVLSDE